MIVLHPDADIYGLCGEVFIRAVRDYKNTANKKARRRILAEIGNSDLMILGSGLTKQELRKQVIKRAQDDDI